MKSVPAWRPRRAEPPPTVEVEDRWTANCGDDAFGEGIVGGLREGRLTMALHRDSCGGTYWIRDPALGNRPVAVFKPSMEEIGMKDNPHGNIDSDRDDVFPPGLGFEREVLAFKLDHQHSARVPQTVRVTHDGRIGSLQRFAVGCTEAGDHLPAKFDVEEVHRIAILDLRLLNCDRHGGNILVQPADHGVTLVPIDHSYVIPSGFSDPDFEWAEWPQAKQPFNQCVRHYVDSLDADFDRDVVLDALGDEEAAEIVWVTTTVLKYAVKAGYTAKEIALHFRRPTLTQPSTLERLLGSCRDDLDAGGQIATELLVHELRNIFPLKSP